MRILYISPEEITFSLAQRLQEAGHTVYVWTEKPGASFQGILKHYIHGKDTWKDMAGKVDLVIYDDADLRINPDELYSIGTPVVCGNSLFDKLENDRLFGKKVFKRLGMDLSTCVHFTDLKEGIAFIKKNPMAWVFKANGQASRTLGYVGREDNGSDVAERMAFYEAELKSNKKLWDKKLGVDFVLEQKVDGIEVACGAYWDGRGFAGININWEHKKLGVGNVGVATGEMGTTIREIGTEALLYKRTLEKLIPLLQTKPYHAYVDLNCIVTKDKAFILEITSRMGWPIEAGLDYMCAIPLDKRLALLAKGMLHDIKNFFKKTYGIVLTAATYGFPYEIAFKELGENQPFKFDPKDTKNIYLIGVDKKNNHLITSPGGDGYVMSVAACGDSIDTCREKAYDIMDRISLPGLYYRTDIGEKTMENFKQLHKWGWV